MNSIFGDMQGKVAAYVDVLIIYSNNSEDHLAQLDHILKQFVDVRLTLKMVKCQFAMAHCEYLGHRIRHCQLHPQIAKIKAIQMFKVSKRNNVRAFLEYGGILPQICETLAAMAAPFSDLTGKSPPRQIKVEQDASNKTLSTTSADSENQGHPNV